MVHLKNDGARVSSWNKVIDENAATVLSTALRITGNLADAEDVSQEVFSEVIRKSSLSPDEDLGGLLHSMAVRRAIDHLRSRKTFHSLPQYLNDRTAETPSDIVASREIEIQLRNAIAELAPRESEVFCLVFFEQLSNLQISKLLGISRNAVGKSLSTARTKIDHHFNSVFEKI